MQIFSFLPSLQAAPTFQPTLDGVQYTITIQWSLFGQRYYVKCTTLTGDLVFNLPLIGSPNPLSILAASWANGIATITATQSIISTFIAQIVPLPFTFYLNNSQMTISQFISGASFIPSGSTIVGNNIPPNLLVLQNESLNVLYLVNQILTISQQSMSSVQSHGFQVGTVVNLTVSGMVPSSYNGTFRAIAINPTQLTYALDIPSGPVSTFGTASNDINLAAGYFNSSLVYRDQNRQFEVTP